VSSNVDGATVSISGLTYGGTPLEPRRITAGSHTVSVIKQGFRPAILGVDMPPGIVTDVLVQLDPAN